MKKNENPSSQFLRTDGGKTRSNAIEVPSVSLPKGGGAIKGIDEKFSVNAVNGTASFSVPLPFSPARGVTPSLALSYNSGSGNSIFGLGWSLGLSSVKRKTDDGLPQYLDDPDTDTFLFSGAEDLVPEFKKQDDGSFELDGDGNYVIHEKDSPDGEFVIRYYRPRTEGLFARIERWRSKISGEMKWRVTTKENGTTLFGWTAGSRIADPGNELRVFEWLPEFVFDDKGNCSQFIYKPEDDKGFDHSLLHNRNRFRNGTIAYTNRYLEKVLYGNKTPYKHFGDAWPAANDYLFSTVFDYGEYDPGSPFDLTSDWNFRSDAFSDYRAGFEIHTTRLCKRVLLFHHFMAPGEYDGLVSSLDFEYDADPAKEFAFLRSVTSCGYIKKQDGSYSKKSLPPIEFSYQAHEWNREVKSIGIEDRMHAPAGPEEPSWLFTDLYQEGLSGILAEQAGGWYYKRNRGNGEFEQARLVSPKPSFEGLGAVMQLTDLDADGGRQLVSYHPSYAGYFELNDENRWQNFRPFKSLPNIDLRDPNTRMLDLNGDGKPEVVITEDQAISWYPGEGRNGFSQVRQALKPTDEEEGPRVIFADVMQTIFLADMSGDGMTDIVRIRNGEVCYWPNLGYGKFGSKVTFDQSPVFDHPDAFNPSFIRLADIDGSGTADIIYLGQNRFSCWKNLSGNRFSALPFEIEPFGEIHTRANVSVTDLLGNGVACIVWSSPLPGDAHAPWKYIDLMNSKKPHILVSWKNNSGKEVSLEYTPSTRFYLDDQRSGRPWATRLHFPVHCVSGTITEDKISGYRFVSKYNYHHGYYDHAEREFRGFGMVEQTDTETFEHWVKGDASNVVEEPLHQEPVVSRVWYHTGAFMDRDHILNRFKEDYWYREMERQGFTAVHHETELPDARLITAPGLDLSIPDHLSGEEWRQALRACKGMGLRTEVFAKDAVKYGNTEEARKRELTPYNVAVHNCIIELIQPKGSNKYAVFAVKKSESVSYSYERNPEDPRIAHSLNIKLDEYGNVLESAAVVYPRKVADPALPPETQQEQNKTVIIYKQNRFTNDVIADESYRLRMPSEVSTYELKGVAKTGSYYIPSDFEDILSDARSDTAQYHETEKPLTPGKAQRRLIEQIRTTYYRNDLSGPLTLHQLQSPALPFESYQLAYTPELGTDLFGTKVNAALLTEGKFTHSEGDDNWWIPSGTTRFIQGTETAADARNRFYMPVSYIDPAGAVTRVTYYGSYFLFVEGTEDALGNKAAVEKFNFRTLSPQRIRDINGNLAETISDELGFVKAMAVMGKGNEADELTGLTEVTEAAERAAIQDFFSSADSIQLLDRAKDLLQRATTRFVYDPGPAAGKPAVVAVISREEHDQTNNQSPVQVAFEYSNGLGEVIMKKVQAEPGKARQIIVNPDNTVTVSEVDTSAADPKQLRWIGNGRIIKNNKGNPVKQYEPYFSVTHHYEDFKELTETGVTPVMYYDAPGRLIRTRMPDGTFSEVLFDSWKQTVYDTQDTLLKPECTWFINRTNRLIDAELLVAGKDPVREKQAADKAAKHANTPNIVHFDTMDRPVLSVEHNKNPGTDVDEFYLTRVKTDTEGNLRSVTDARGNTVMQYKCDMLGTPVWQNSMDAGQRWLLFNIMGNPVRTWDERGHEFRYFYDSLQRPTQTKVLGGDGPQPLDHIVGRVIYGESLLLPDRSNEAGLQSRNMLGQAIQQYDTGGLIDTPDYDFKGHALAVTRKLFKKYKEVPDWTDANLVSDLEAGSFTFTTETDAMGRITRQTAPNGSIFTPAYNEAGLLNSETVLHPGAATPVTYIKNIDYNEKGQREKIIYGNDVITRFYYDRETFRLLRIETKRQNNDPLQDLHYTYDAAGNITHLEDKNVPVVFFDNQKVTGTAEYTYDALYRLVSATGRENTASLTFGSQDNRNDAPFMHQLNPGDPMTVRNYIQQYRYDEVGNIKQMKHQATGNNWTRNQVYETANNRLTSTHIGDNGDPADYTNYQYHARHGFMTALPHLEETGWNFKEELVRTIRQKVNPGNGTAETTWYQYDAQGQRIRKITENSAPVGAVPTIKEERIYLSGYELYKKHSGPDAGLERVCLSLMDGGHRFVMTETRNDVDDGTEKQLVRYQLHNQIGSATLELDDTARVISYEEYHPYGTTAYQAKNASVRSAAKRYRYTGMERDEETGLGYHGARYYLPWLGRWLSCDPAGIGDGVNVYSYCRDNPVSFNDQTGLSVGDEEKPSQILDLEKMIGIPDRSSGDDPGGGIVDRFWDTLSSIGNAIGEAIVAAGNWIAETAAKFWNWIKDAAVTAWNWIKQAAADAWNWIKQAASNAWNWIKGALGTAWDWTKNAVSAAWNWTKEAVSTAWNWIREAAGAAWEWMKNAAASAWEWIKQAAADTWNWFLAPMIRTATNALGGFAIGFLSGGMAGGVIGALTGTATGMIHGWTMAQAHSYDWSSLGGWMGFLADNTWGLPNSMVGSLFATANIMGGNPVDLTNSRNSNALMFENEWFSGYATTLGNVIVGTKGLSHAVLEHELAHVLQARIFGPVFYPSMIVHYAINTILPYWLLYHNKRYPNTPIRNFGEYFSRGVYPHTWAEEWGYAIGGHPN
ncbi:MAG: SpvB/TcaC N-terminal domain-containing protein [Mangrovibacterium sp.]